MKKPSSPLRLAREWRGLTIRQLHDATAIATGRLSMLERGMVRPQVSEIERLCTALASSIDRLFPALAWPEFAEDRAPVTLRPTGS
jgi:transcriptional regulator with XRE-family HTH domain